MSKEVKRKFSREEKDEWVEKFMNSSLKLSKFIEGTDIPYSTFSDWITVYKNKNCGGALGAGSQQGARQQGEEPSAKKQRVRVRPSLASNDFKPVEIELINIIRQRIISGKRTLKPSQQFTGVSWPFMRDKAMKIAERVLQGEALANFMVTDAWLKKILKKHDINDIAPYKPDDKLHLRLARQFQLQSASLQHGSGRIGVPPGLYSAGADDEDDDEDSIDAPYRLPAATAATVVASAVHPHPKRSHHPHPVAPVLAVPEPEPVSNFTIVPQPRPTDLEIDNANRILLRLSLTSRSKALQAAVRRLAYEVFQERLVFPYTVATEVTATGASSSSSSSTSKAAGKPASGAAASAGAAAAATAVVAKKSSTEEEDDEEEDEEESGDEEEVIEDDDDESGDDA